MEDDIENLPDAVLLALPEAQVSPGALTLLWARKADTLRQRDLNELNDELNGLSRSRRMLGPGQVDEADARRRRELKAREEDLLRRINIEQERIIVEMEELDKRTIRLHDGRRAYVDGKEYRDGQGRVLQGADHDEAEAQHLQNPNAATWTERKDLERQLDKAKDIKDRVQQQKDNPEALAQDEKEFAQQVEARTAQLEKNPSLYGDGDYAALYSGVSVAGSMDATAKSLTPAFSQVSRETISEIKQVAQPNQVAPDPAKLKQ